ncbi:MAG: carboxypeptidase regulatory-like domain-containing protein [Acidobacteriota bacterium]|nr:carboxypeptidase regulatory-like domain-containing protein [Acidobacteriota bacterium]
MLLVCSFGWGQGLSTINGSVTDPSGASIPGARIIATEVDTSLARQADTNGEGVFVLTGLRPTRYTLTATAPSFRQLVQKGIVLEANDALTLTLRLEVGATTDTVNVEANAVQVDTSTPTLKQVVDSARMIELPLNGRNAAQLTALVAGAVNAPSNNSDQGPTKTFPGAVTVSVNGSRTNNIAFNLDGVHSQDIFSNVNQPLPMPDALQEFSFQTSNFSAEYGQNSSGVVNVVTKSGTNSFHGGLFTFVRNAQFNARNFFANKRDQLKREQFGGTLGGPIIRDKLFFFGGYQGTRIRNTQNGLSAFVPTAANLAGDFSAYLNASDPNNPLRRAIAIKDPANNQLFPGNIIPVSRFEPASLAMLKFLPAASGGNGLAFYSAPIIQNFEEFIARADYSVSASDRLNYRINKSWYRQPGILANNNLLTYADETPDSSYNTALQESHIFSPSLLNDFRFAVTREITSRHPPKNTPNVRDFGVQNVYQTPNKAIESFNVSGFFGFGAFADSVFARTTFDWYDTVRWVKGRHNLAIGGSFERARFNHDNHLFQNGTYSFTGDNSNSAIADFLLGSLRTFTQGWGSFQKDRNLIFSLFIQDTFKASSRLTLSYGLRFEPSFPWHDLFRQAEAFSPARYNQGLKSKVYTNAYPGMLFPGDEGFPEDGRSASWNNFGPRFGFAYDPFGDGKTSVRGGAGIFLNSRNPGFSNDAQVQTSPFSPTVSLTNPAGGFRNPYLGVNNPFPLPFPVPHDFVFPTPVRVYSWDASHFKLQTPTVYNWNLTIERQLRPDWLARVAYVASRTNHLLENEQLNPALYVPGSTLSNDARRPFQPYTSIVQSTFSGNAWYNSLQMSLEKRFTRGFTILANYTWSKSTDNIPFGTDNTSPQLNAVIAKSPYTSDYKSLDKGPSDFDYRHVFVASYVWQLPSLSRANRFVRAAGGGWQLSGIWSAQSGVPLSISAGLDRSQTGIGFDKGQLVAPIAYGPGACQNRAPCVESLVPSAFALPALGTYGNLSKGALRGPGLFNSDIGLFKTFTIHEGLTVQARAEFFNFLNRANFNPPGTTVNSGNFGAILSARDPRIGQLALKIQF